MVVCRATMNGTQRLELELSKLLYTNNLYCNPINGTLVRADKSVISIGNDPLILAGNLDGSEALLFDVTSDRLAKPTTKVVEYNESLSGNIYAQALLLCEWKYANSLNYFELECELGTCTCVVSPALNEEGVFEGKFTYCFKTPGGNLVNISDNVPKDILTGCKGLRSFKYRVVNSSCEREITVKRGSVEIFKEIANYLNKMLVFTSVVSSGQFVSEVCLSSVGACVTRKHGSSTKMAKVPYTKLSIPNNATLHAAECRLDVLLRSCCVSDAISGGV